jgi:hypothetical protein
VQATVKNYDGLWAVTGRGHAWWPGIQDAGTSKIIENKHMVVVVVFFLVPTSLLLLFL